MTQVVCAKCGQVLRPTDKFCYNCGAKVVPIKMAPEVKAEEPKPETIRNIPRTPAPAETQEERPKFHMDENMNWNTDGYPEAQKHPTEEPNFTWADESAQDRIRKRQEEGRRALYEEQQAREAAKAKALAEENDFSETPEAEDVIKAVEAESIIPAEDIKAKEPEVSVEEPEAEETEAMEAEAPAVEEAPVSEPEEAAEAAPEPVSDDASEPEADDDYVVPTIESIEADAEAVKAKEVEKEIFGYTIDDVEANNGNGPEVIDKFYTYSKKNEEFQELLNQENDKLKNNRPELVPETAAVSEAPEPEEAPAEEEKPLTDEEAGGFVGVQFPETPMEADVSEPKSEFLDGNFGKYDNYAQPEEAPAEEPAEKPVEPEEKAEEGSKVAAAAGAVAASAALAAIAEKARARAAEAELKAEDADEQLDVVTDKTEEIKEEAEEKLDEAAEKVEEVEEAAEEKVEAVEEAVEEKAEEVEETVEEKAEEIREEAEDSFDKVKEEAEEVKDEAEDSFEKAKEEVEAAVDKAVEEAEDDHKLTYQEVFSDEAEKTPKHTFLKIIAILILLLIILEVVAILIRRFAPDSAAGLQIQQIYEMLFSRFTGQ